MGAAEHPKYASDFSARRYVLHNADGRTSDPSLSLPGRSWPILRPWQHGPKYKIVGEGASLMHPPAINKYLISAHTIVSCTKLMGGRSGKVLACPEHPGRFYGRGKTGPYTGSSRKNRKIGSRGVGMGSKSGRAHALGCPEWVLPGAGSREGVLGMLWWFSCHRPGSNAYNTCRY